MQTLTIPREDFQAAIEAGIEASPTLLERERARLRALADTALSVGTNFSDGCPATLAGLCVAEYVPGRAVDFATAYDDAMGAAAWRKMRAEGAVSTGKMYGYTNRVAIV